MSDKELKIFGDYLHKYNKLCNKYDELLEKTNNNSGLLSCVHHWFDREAKKLNEEGE